MSSNLWNKLSNAKFVAAVVVGSALSVGNAFAQPFNLGPPTGAILDLNGTAINHGSAVEESVSFVAGVSSTAITFAFREDPAYILFSDVSLTDTTTSSSNLIANGDFSSGSGSNATDWTYANIYGATYGGSVDGSCGNGLTSCWDDGAVQAYDAISQTVGTTIGDTYLLSFFYWDDGGNSTFSDLSTNGDISNTGGNGIDILAYAQAGLPPAAGTPEPDSIVLVASGLAGLAGMYKRRRSA